MPCCTPTRANRTVAFSNSASSEIIWGLGGPEDHQRHHCCWTDRVGEREEEEYKLYSCKHTQSCLMIRIVLTDILQNNQPTDVLDDKVTSSQHRNIFQHKYPEHCDQSNKTVRITNKTLRLLKPNTAYNKQNTMYNKQNTTYN